MPIQIYNPDTLEKPTGLYSVVTRVHGGELLFTLWGRVMHTLRHPEM